jgi:hypothetical protein
MAPAHGKSPGGRLKRLHQGEDLLPWRRAWELDACFLYWLPISAFPTPTMEVEWQHRFLDRLATYLGGTHGLRAELFAEFKNIALKARIVNRSLDWLPTPGLARRPGSQLAKVPDTETLLELTEGGARVDPGQFIPDYVYWMVVKDWKEQTRTLVGEGGSMILFLPETKETTPPELPMSPKLARNFGLEKPLEQMRARMKALYAMRDPFLERSKEVFGEGLPRDLQFKGLQFIVPLLETDDFLGNAAEDTAKSLELFPVYIRETTQHPGLLMASAIDFEDDLVEILRSLREQAA